MHPKERKWDNFLPTMTRVFVAAKYFGIPTYGGKAALVGALVLLTMLVTLEFFSIWKLIRTLNGWNLNPKGSITARLSGSIFYGNALLSMLITWRIVNKWKDLSEYWLQMETKSGLVLPPDKKIRRRTLFVTGYVVVCALVEHILSMMSATGLDCPFREYFERYILSSHGFLLEKREYSLWLAIPIFILSKLATALWNFQDLIIILISMGLASKYHRLNAFVRRVVVFERRMKAYCKLERTLVSRINTWRKLRESYAHQANLVRKVDQSIGGLILLSNLNNFYFICLQLFLGIGFIKEDGTVINRVYYFYSLAWLLFRACAVLLAASDIRMHSQRAIPILNMCTSAGYNIEIKRLKYQIEHEKIWLSGMGLFYLSRQKLLEVAGAIVKYELILLQYDKQKT
ncbi:unnamed protein product [Leptosia nina]|uniref:Gustatory receptor n=1 Tax=Leptosia nina TaxID=320188 RepID=A0AAV1JJV2_9NEOP